MIDDEGALVGLVSLDDILDLLAEEFADIGRLIREEEPGSLGRRGEPASLTNQMRAGR